MEIDSHTIVRVARGFIGVRWRHQGRTVQNGIDCVGLPVLVGERLDMWEALPAQYPRRPDGTFVSLFREYLDPVKPADVQEGDVLVFAEGGHPCHCGIYSLMNGEPAVVHSHAGMRKVVEQTLESSLQLIGKPIFIFRYPGVH